MGKKQKLENLEAWMDAAAKMLADNNVAVHVVELARSKLMEALTDGRFSPHDEPGRRGYMLVAQLVEHEKLMAAAEASAQASEAQVRLEKFVVECPCCRGTEFLVGEDCKLSVSYGHLGSNLTCVVVVCKTCGDLRMHATDITALVNARDVIEHPVFRSVMAPPARGPFR